MVLHATGSMSGSRISASRSCRSERIHCITHRCHPHSATSQASYGSATLRRIMRSAKCSGSPLRLQHSRRCSGRRERVRAVVRDASEQAQVALEGDLVYVHFDCSDETGELLESTRGDADPISFEVGAGDLFQNEMIQALDAAVRGLAVGDVATIKAQGNPWNQELLFAVPRDHPEMQRLEGRYKNVGGLAKDLVVELANGQRAVVLELTDELVKIDANSMLAGKSLAFELELVKIEGGQ